MSQNFHDNSKIKRSNKILRERKINSLCLIIEFVAIYMIKYNKRCDKI